MNKQEFVPIFDKLCIAYTDRLVRHTNTPEQKADIMRVYFLILKDLEVELVQAAALEFMAGPSAFPPTPGQIREMAVNLQKRGNNVPSSAEAWQMVMLAPADGKVSWSEEKEDGWHIYNQPYQWTHPLVEKVARNMGWPGRFWTDSLMSDRSRFMNAYEAEMDRATGEVTSLPEVHDFLLARGKGDMKKLLDGFRGEAMERGE